MPIGSDVQNTTYADLRAAREPAKKKKSEKKDKKRKLIRSTMGALRDKRKKR